MLFKTQFDVHQTDFTLIVTDKLFCLMSIIHCFVLFWFPFYFSVFVFFFHYRGGDEPKVRFLYRNAAVYLRRSFMA